MFWNLISGTSIWWRNSRDFIVVEVSYKFDMSTRLTEVPYIHRRSLADIFDSYGMELRLLAYIWCIVHLIDNLGQHLSNLSPT